MKINRLKKLHLEDFLFHLPQPKKIFRNRLKGVIEKASTSGGNVEFYEYFFGETTDFVSLMESGQTTFHQSARFDFGSKFF